MPDAESPEGEWSAAEAAPEEGGGTLVYLATPQARGCRLCLGAMPLWEWNKLQSQPHWPPRTRVGAD